MTSVKTVTLLIRAARPTFRNQNDKIAFAVHSSLLASGYVLTATGSDALSDAALSDPSNDEVSVEHWNDLNDGEYAFVYAAVDPEIKEKKNVLVKCLAMNDKLVVHALRLGDSEPLYLQINVGDYAAGEDGGGGRNYVEQHFKDLEKLLKRIDSVILSKLLGWPPPPIPPPPPEIIFPLQIPPPPPPPPCSIPHSPPPPYPRGGGSMHVDPKDPRWFGGGGGFRGGLPVVPPPRPPRLAPSVPGFEPNKFARNPPPPPPPPPPRLAPQFEPNRFARNPPPPPPRCPDLQHFRRDAD
ncbi:probable proteasome inhibitor [Lotus japonicus]|uniref:probable proteasome inhibitor n=1 Tax=Lotus japonicus TaxID=34305 RepID=UPI002585A118|nr:probable proteasome inhibitor [Lotus japonicus]